MNSEDLEQSLIKYKTQLKQVSEALGVCTDDNKKISLISLQDDLNQLITLTEENLKTIAENTTKEENSNEIDDEYALFMEEMAKSGAYDDNQGDSSQNKSNEMDNKSDHSDIEDELSTLLGMKCAVYHTHMWGGEPTLYNAMVSSVLPRDDNYEFRDLQVRVLFTQPTHPEMLPCTYYLDGECRFDDEHCRYSHGSVVYLSNLREAIDPDFESLKIGSKVLVKLKPPVDEDITLKKSTEKYHLWHRSVIRSINFEKKSCIAKLEHGAKGGDKRKSDANEINVPFENIFPLNNEVISECESDDSLSDCESREQKVARAVLEPATATATASPHTLGHWEKHTRGIGSKLMFAMGYVAGSGLGASGEGRVQPVAAAQPRTSRRAGLDDVLQLNNTTQIKSDPLKLEQKLKRMQKKEEERQKRAYEREIERERRNVFNFLNKAIGDQAKEANPATPSTNIKQTTTKDLNIEQFKINEETKKLDKEIIKLNSSLSRHAEGTSGHRNIKSQIVEKHKELDALKIKEKLITKEQMQRKDKQKMTIF